MSFHISVAHFALALAFGGGFLLGLYGYKKSIQKKVTAHWHRHYLTQYNVQMSELCARYRQERLAMIHRYEGLTADLEVELKALSVEIDPDATKKSYIANNIEALEGAV